jgi:hypothetical protein
MPTKVYSFRIPDAVIQRVDEVAATQNMTRNALVVELLSMYAGCLDIDAATGLPRSDTNGSQPF